MHIFGCKFSLKTEAGDTVPDRKNFDSLLWAIVTVFQVCSALKTHLTYESTAAGDGEHRPTGSWVKTQFNHTHLGILCRVEMFLDYNMLLQKKQKNIYLFIFVMYNYLLIYLFNQFSPKFSLKLNSI